MAGKKAPRVLISSREYDLLDSYIKKRRTSHSEKKRIEIILKGSKGSSTYSISKEINLGIDSVRRWRTRWGSKYEELQYYKKGKEGKGVEDVDLLKKMLEVFKDRPRVGCPCIISSSEKRQIIAMACQKPSEYGIIESHWTHQKLAKVAKEKKVVKSISPSYVGKILKKGEAPSA